MFHDVPGVLLMMPVFALFVILLVQFSSSDKRVTQADAFYRSQHHHRDSERKMRRQLKKQGSSDDSEKRAA